MKLLIKFFFFKNFKKILMGLSSSGGRNILGRICVYHQGGGNKRRFRLLDRFRRLNQYGYIFKVLSDSFKTAFIGIVLYNNGLISFIMLSHGVVKGSKIFSGYILNSISVFKNGSALLLKDVNLFSVINSVEIFPFSGSKLARAAGSSAYLVSKDINKVTLKLNSGWQIKVSNNVIGALGIASNPFFIFSSIKKAGKNRAFGIRPTVRGVIKNPCDHPHGGGEGRGSPPVAPVTPWGFLTKGTPTKNKKVDRKRRRLFKKF